MARRQPGGESSPWRAMELTMPSHPRRQGTHRHGTGTNALGEFGRDSTERATSCASGTPGGQQAAMASPKTCVSAARMSVVQARLSGALVAH